MGTPRRAGRLNQAPEVCMRIEVLEEWPPDWLAYGSVPIRFTATSALRVRHHRSGHLELDEDRLPAPLEKDYDAIAGEGPERWARRFDVSRWGVLVARVDGERVGGAVLVADTAGVNMLDGRSDLAVLWDLRVHPDWRGRGVGKQLFRRAEEWAIGRGKAELKVETQDINVPACRFYATMGCTLRTVTPGAYASLPEETQLLWYKRLAE